MTQPSPSKPFSQDPSLLKLVTGMTISGGLAYLFVRLLQSILHNLPPIAIDGSPLARSLSIGVRYMLVGSIGLLAFMFALVTVGLLSYCGQLGWQGLRGQKQDAIVQSAANNTPIDQSIDGPEGIAETQNDPPH